ncbi:MAG: hypothetical protein EBV32_05530 [Proteobacteria bacterium]|uniref:Uncharacterized protein n=1 Tax=Candidatus Fonsibacter lacus TaxID=2576439 RepID=A0A964UZA1_9PROT|nr:hypothetical protein [Candidatus Fonsibacter lacus]NBP59663.1 hypothetical protein [Pseudomonadota bacterium]NCU72599.1 hypothetical protein [Candidatus Fonsibacter lacus]
MNSQMFNKEYIYPKIWDDNDIIKFKYYLKEAKDMYDNKMPENFIELCCERQINEEKGLVEPIDYSKVEELEIRTPMYEELKTEIDDDNCVSIEA